MNDYELWILKITLKIALRIYIYNSIGPTSNLSYRHFRNFASIPRRTTAQFLNTGVKFINPLTFVTGWHPDRIVHCEMHVVHLGICQWCNACAVILLAKFGFWGPGKLNENLESLTRRFNAWCRLNGIRWGYDQSYKLFPQDSNPHFQISNLTPKVFFGRLGFYFSS
jgi:hypothetical protein